MIQMVFWLLFFFIYFKTGHIYDDIMMIVMMIIIIWLIYVCFIDMIIHHYDFYDYFEWQIFIFITKVFFIIC